MITNCRSSVIALLLLPWMLTGCRIDTHKNGADKDVSIGTPFGSMHVKTDEPAVAARIGLTPYPGATVVRKNNDSGVADVNLSFGSFKLGVLAMDLQSNDPEDKVLAFYRKDMARYGAVLSCRGKQAVGEPTRTADGLTCGTDEHDAGSGEMQLRSGSELHQHIVGVRSRDGGTRIGLVALDLPAGMNHHGNNDRE